MFGLLLVALGVGLDAQRPPARSLRSVLMECGCLVAGVPETLLSTLVEDDAAAYSDEQGCIVAFWEVPEDDSPLHVIAGNVQTGTWTHQTFPAPRGISDPARGHGPLSIERWAPMTLISARVAIDGVGTSILNSNLERVGAVYGIIHAILPNGFVLYQHAQPHFGPKHWVQLAVLDTRAGKEREIFPRAPFSRVRRNAIRASADRYKRLGGFDWCRVNNDPCDPERFDTDLSWTAKAVVNAQAHAFALLVTYSDPEGRVVVTCENMQVLARIECHETPLTAWQRLFPNESEEQILQRAAATPRRVPWR